MSTDPYAWRETGRLEDGHRRTLVAGVDHGVMTLRIFDGRAVELSAAQEEELGQLVVAATWQAGLQRRQMAAAAGALAGGKAGVT